MDKPYNGCSQLELEENTHQVDPEKLRDISYRGKWKKFEM